MNSQPHRTSSASTSRTVLLVEDEVLLRMMLADELRAQRYKVIEAANSDDALGILHSGTPVDGIVTDVKMPGSLDGLGLASVVRRSWPSVKIVVASAHALDVLPDAADAVFTKPYNLDKLIFVLNAVLGASRTEDGGHTS